MDIHSFIQATINTCAALVLAVAAFFAPMVAAPETPVPIAQEEFPTAAETPAPQPAKQPVVQTPTPTPLPVPALPTVPALSDTELNDLVRGALVNILCTTLSGGAFKPISGSGVIIDSRGIILTNAHVGQFFLLRDYIVKDNITCVVRIGSPAQTRYTAELVYLPQSWINQNAAQIAAPVSTGTGENDYALLRITGTTNPSGILPSSFPALATHSTPPKTQERMIIASYPAGLVGGTIIATSLFASSAFSTVSQVFSFGDEPVVDTFAIRGTVASQAGSSGGVVADVQGRLRGVITTANLGATTGESTLFAITLGHISRSLAAEGQGGIEVLLDGNIAAKAAQFNSTTAKIQTKILEDILNGQ